MDTIATHSSPMPKKKPLKPVAIARALWAYGRIVRDPNRLDEVFNLSDALTNPVVMERIAVGIRARGGSAALAEKHRIEVRLDVLDALPEGSFGRAHSKFMRDNGLAPESIPHLDSLDEHTYIRAHLYETHDIWHTAAGFGSDVAGELGLQGFYASQVDGALPAALLAAGLLNTALTMPADREHRYHEIGRGIELGRRAKPFFGVKWDLLWEKPLGEVREELGVA
jgi:ubiquinone biosynthesis protein COQ4